MVRARFVEYVGRFVRLASRYEEDVFGVTNISFPTSTFSEGPGDSSQLGSGIVFLDDTAGSREVMGNTSRIEGWRRTAMYRICQEVTSYNRPQSVISHSGLAHISPFTRILSSSSLAAPSEGLISIINYGDCASQNTCKTRR